MSVAAKIADNLTFADDVSDEDVKHKPILAEYIETESGKKSKAQFENLGELVKNTIFVA